MLHYYETWESVGCNETFKVMLWLVVNFNYIPYQFDIETAFIHGEMDTLVHVKQVTGYEEKGKENCVWRLRKSLYGTKQAPRMWKSKLESALSSLGLMSTRSDESLLINAEKLLLLHVHVNDGFIISQLENKKIEFLTKLNSIFKLKSKKKPTQNLGYTLKWSSDKIMINQTDHITKTLQQFNMNDCKPVKTPCNGNFLNEVESGISKEVLNVTLFQQAIGSINYLAHHTRPDILFMGSKDKFPIYDQCTTKEMLTGWADVDYANVKDDRKSITGYVILALGNPVCWLSKKQSVVSQSTTEAEYIAMNICMKQLRWITFFFSDLGYGSIQPILYNDNSGAVTILKQAALNANTKHIEVRYQYVRDCVMKKLVTMFQVSTNDMIADILMKPFGVINMQEVFRQLHLKDSGGVL
ncbi:hypothetical protein O181_032900 [Austropuccinia psidii MF-1]|uniref:Reverse transcriptase Ty1/copia-type domain-containing protein n=1 Tax=Austropuccinia psidii MF-1 TaxID=1389203 RepID=A0A9Q3D0E9_9BASI|nr:hypothetical protein [Austropuccinia psidii MF-1]